jgi:YidC/Oxa1 family membrane protein insertase
VSIAGFSVPILPLIMGATMFLQQRMTPTPADNAQAKMMMYMMPAMFTFFLLFLPSGLTLYILTNTVLTMMHQWYMNHSD